MKFYSEITKNLYDTKEDLVKAEVAATKEKSERAVAAKKVNDLLKEAKRANKEANKALADFVEKYGSFKTTLTDTDIESERDKSFWDILDIFTGF